AWRAGRGSPTGHPRAPALTDGLDAGQPLVQVADSPAGTDARDVQGRGRQAVLAHAIPGAPGEAADLPRLGDRLEVGRQGGGRELCRHDAKLPPRVTDYLADVPHPNQPVRKWQARDRLCPRGGPGGPTPNSPGKTA